MRTRLFFICGDVELSTVEWDSVNSSPLVGEILTVSGVMYEIDRVYYNYDYRKDSDVLEIEVFCEKLGDISYFEEEDLIQ